MTARASLWILWPGFLLACSFELLVFALVDPADLRWGSESLGLSRQAVYTIGFFVFWVLAASSSALTMLLVSMPVRDLSKPPE